MSTPGRVSTQTTNRVHTFPTSDPLLPFSPPWTIVPRDGQYCVTVKESGETVKCHDNEADARAHLHALYVNVDEGMTWASAQGFTWASSPYHVELFSADSDGEIARRALAGEPILIMPLETFYDHWGEIREVSNKTVEQFVENWNHRLDRGIRRRNLAVDIDHKGGAIGWYKEVMPLKGLGLGASFNWNRQGREALESGEYAYFSPTVYWRVRDRKTGAIVENQLAGGALTNYPYFGEETALMSRTLVQPDGWQSPINSGGFDMADQETVTLNQDELSGIRRFMSLFGGQIGSSDPPPAAPSPAVDPSVIEEMSNRLGTLEENLSTVTQERDQARDQVARLNDRLGSVEVARQTERFNNIVASEFSHLPGEVSQIAGTLMWLYNSDQPNDEGTRAHYEFISELLRRADAAFSDAFDTLGTGAGHVADEQARIDQAISTYQTEHPDASYEQAAEAVFAARPELGRLYEQTRQTNREVA